MAGICTYGGYVPRYRLDRGGIVGSMAWINPVIMMFAQGDKAVANFDEDTVTMGVAAGIDALTNVDSASIEGIYFASTSMPYKERLNAGIIALGTNVNENIRGADFSGTKKAGTTALLSAIESVESKRINNILVTSSECRLGKPGSTQEMIFGDAAASFVVGDKDVIAELKDSYSSTYDFTDQMRGADTKFVRQWEERWVRDVGYVDFIKEAVNAICDQNSMKVGDFTKIIYPCHNSGGRKKINGILGIAPEQEQSNLQAEIGDCGTALPLVMLSHALESANAGDKILVIGYGNGCDALYFEITDEINKKKPAVGISGYLANKAALDQYTKYLVWRGILPGETGLRGETTDYTALSALWRKRKQIMGLWGTKCTACNSPQFPPQRICANPECRAIDQTEPYRFADKIAHVVSFTGDMLAASFDPPSIYGRVQFEGGGRNMFDFTDCTLEDVGQGTAVTMSFRRKYHDNLRDIVGYYWKCVPVKEVK
ncbi:MAG: hypothetical protein KAH06_02380 [Desulfobacterales bacterium]|nr:hypothetical protein [Desulfobacterales bacterium]